MNTKSDVQILEDAATIIERNGWHQGDLAAWGGDWFEQIKAGSPCCIVGAVHVAGDSEYDRYMWELATSAITEKGFYSTAPGWNDAPERTKEEVIAALRNAAARLRDGGSA